MSSFQVPQFIDFIQNSLYKFLFKWEYKVWNLEPNQIMFPN
jgi:hypothetical protein